MRLDLLLDIFLKIDLLSSSMPMKNYLNTAAKAESVDEATLKRIFGEGVERLTPEERLTILEALKEARQRNKFLSFPCYSLTPSV